MISRGLKFSFLYMAISILQICFVQATNYYLSANGDDQNVGTSMDKPWRTLDRMNKQKLLPGDHVFFHAGHTFRGSLYINHSGSEEAPIVISSYREGEKPELKGTINIRGFKPEGNNLYAATVENNIGQLYHNGRMLTIARYPNHGFLTMDGGGADYLFDDMSFTPEQLVGATLRIRPLNWIYQTRTITGVNENKISFDKPLFHTSRYQTTCNNGWGYYVENKPAFLDQHGEWYYDKEQKKVYVYSTKKLTDDLSMEASVVENGIVIQQEKSHIIIEGLHLSGYQNNGITALGENENVKITECVFNHIYKMGVQGGLHCSNFKIQNNVFQDIYGRGISFLESNNCRFSNNKLKRIGIVHGQGMDGLNGGVGILMTNHEKRDESERKVSHSNYIGYNVIDSTGYISVRMDGIKSICEYNVISNALLTLNDGALIYCWGKDPDFTHHNIIRNNIVSYAHGNTEGTPSDHKMNIGIYIDNRAHDISVLNNVVHDAGSGIHVNDGSYNNTLRGNVLYANRVGISFAEFSKSNDVLCENNTCTKNIIFNTHNLNHTLSLKHTYEPDFNPGIIDSNLYVSPYEVYHLKKETMEEGCKVIKEHTFESWKKKTVHDQNSMFVDAGPESKSILLTNKNDKAKTIPLDDSLKYKDLHGKRMKGNVVLQPYESKILLYSYTD